MNTAPRLSIALAKPSELAAVRALIIQGLTQRWKSYEPSRNPDLESFDQCYADAVIVVAKEAGKIIGCGVLRKESDGIGRIVRMSVLGERQRQGIGSEVLRVLLAHAAEIGYQEVVLETTASWVSAVSFYKRYGFVPITIHDGDQHFRFPIKRTPDASRKGDPRRR
jgi:ribosomal protein S18 acetylase RimI-like enzyme